MKLIVGLGNPGRGYANNRHNVGFTCLNHFARTQGIRFDKKKGKARIGTGEVAGYKIVVAKPQTYMNLSGQSVRRLIRKFSINLDDLLVIHDDLDLPLGKIRIRHGSGSGGHKGIYSIITELGSQDFLRLRVGIGRPVKNEGFIDFSEGEIVNYVLSDFTPDEKQTIIKVIPEVSEAILCLLTEGLAAAMNKYN
ncbi:MAG TPA: aminoacyl-tRNA hydrolase [Dehalococcoidia bacterium]|nr:aminoacyl-tRNA hydrolase [Dehalococcoidia bacterium]